MTPFIGIRSRSSRVASWAASVALLATLFGSVADPSLATSAPVTTRDVSTSVGVTVGTKLIRECGPHGKSCVGPFRQLIVSFVSRIAVPTAAWYEVTLTFVPTGRCQIDQSGEGGPILQSIRAGQRVNEVFDVRSCPRIIHGAVAYNGTNAAPHKQRYVPGVGYIDGLLVGTFGLRMS